jgi:SRSO17 transposase
MFVHGILSGPARKNGWTLAEYAGESDPNGMQRLLTTARWDVDGVRDDLRDWVLERFGDTEHGVLVPTEVGFAKKGTASVGVHRQYNGLAGRAENVQLGLFLSYVVAGRSALIDRELYLPQAWAADLRRCRDLGVPDGVGFASRPQLARQMIERTPRRPGPAPWVAADEVYGDDATLRSWLDRQDLRYILATRCPDRLSPVRSLVSGARDAAAHIPRPPWERHRSDDGSTCYDWARMPAWGESTPTAAPRGWENFLLVRRSTTGPARFAYYHCRAPAGTPVGELARVAGTAAGVPGQVAGARGDLGLDRYQVRRYDAWYRHMTLCLLAGAYLAVAR